MQTTTIKAADGRGTLGWTDGHFTFALETRTNVLVPGVFGSSTAATAADIVACLRANPEAAEAVMLALADRPPSVTYRERAEQAEHSLAASERALAALRYQAQADAAASSVRAEDFVVAHVARAALKGSGHE